MYDIIIDDWMRASVILGISSSDLEACDREICIIVHTTDVRIKELFYYLFNVFFACGNFIAATISGDVYNYYFFNQRVQF